MSKYDALSSFLDGLPNSSNRMRFAEIEDVLGFALPRSARKYQAWWANDDRDGRHAASWLSAGWLTEQIDLAGEAVSFRRANAASAEKTKRAGRAVQTPLAQPEFENLTDALGGSVDIAIAMQWKHLGALMLGEPGKLTFPEAPAVPALYRLRLIGAAGMRQYIGEAINLKRRFGSYRNPGPTQATSLRLNDLLVAHLKADENVAVDVILTGIELSIAGQKVTFDLAEKATRRLLEQAALVADNATEIESLNR